MSRALRRESGTPRSRASQISDQIEPGDLQTRDAILDAAERLFAARGFDAATIKHIGAEAGVNSALIYYYFRDKRGLHQAVLDRFGEELFARARTALDAAHSAEDVVRAVVGTQSAMFAGYPQRARILARELIDHDAEHAGELLESLGRNVFARLRDAIAAEQRTGRFRSDLDPGYAALSTIAQVVYFHLARPVVRIVLRDRGPIGRGQEQEFAAHAAEFALAALRSGTPPRGGSRTGGTK
jgi:TetR/AcrR family transcriptional regulator